VPVGALLSSGVDSSLVCALAAGLTNRGIHCFGAGFVGDRDDGTPQARAIAEHLGLPFEALAVSADDLATGTRGFGAQLDEPNGDRSCVPTFLLSRLIRSRVTVAISGDGGDELFAGYGRYAVLAQEAAWRDGSPNEQAAHYFHAGLPMFERAALDAAFPGEAGRFVSRFVSRFASVFARDELDTYARLRMVDLHSYLPGAVLAKVDRMAMKHSLEVRTPFFSPAMLALSSRLPPELVQERGLLKLALRRLLARHLPPELILAKKQGFGMPGSFFGRNEALFRTMAEHADEVLRHWAPLRDRPAAWAALQQGARANINSLWAWTALGQWVESLPAAG
jgi:asparagine synthase (glutamine-hydrolysing)